MANPTSGATPLLPVRQLDSSPSVPAKEPAVGKMPSPQRSVETKPTTATPPPAVEIFQKAAPAQSERMIKGSPEVAERAKPNAEKANSIASDVFSIEKLIEEVESRAFGTSERAEGSTPNFLEDVFREDLKKRHPLPDVVPGEEFASRKQATLGGSQLSPVQQEKASGSIPELSEQGRLTDHQVKQVKNGEELGPASKSILKTKKFLKSRGLTNQISQTVVLMQRLGIRSSEDIMKNLDKLRVHINNKDLTKEEQWKIFEEAIKFYSTQDALFVVSSRKMNDIKKAFFRTTPPTRQEIFSHKAIPGVKSMEDFNRVVDNYDVLKESQKELQKTGETLLELVGDATQTECFCENIIIGAGDNGVTVWNELYTAEHESTQKDIQNEKLPNTLVLAESVGNWNPESDYQFEQSHNLLERPGEVNPSDFASANKYKENARVNARTLYNANQVIKAKTNMPILPSNVESLEIQENHLKDWKDKNYKYRVKITTQEDPPKTKIIYTNHVDICAGLGRGRDVFKNCCSEKDYALLTTYNPKKGYTPLLNANELVLKKREKGKTEKDILVYGGGGGAAAAVRVASFQQDADNPTFGKDQPLNPNVQWMARAGFGDVLLATQAQEAVDYGKEHNLLIEGNIIKFEPTDNGKVKVTYEEYTRLNQEQVQELQAKGQKIEVRQLGNKDVPVLINQKTMIKDQVISAAGQDSAPLNFLIKEFQPIPSKIKGEIVGAQNANGSIRLHGGAAVALGSIGTELQQQLLSDSAPRDASVAGIMPPSRAGVVASRKDRGELTACNVNTDLFGTIEGVLRKKLSQEDTNKFIAFLKEARQSTGTGVTPDDLNAYIKTHSLEGVLGVEGLSIVYLK